MQTNWVSLAITIAVISVSLGFQSWSLFIQGSALDERKKAMNFTQAGKTALVVSVIFFVLAVVFIVWNACIVHAGNLNL